jgi:Tol biopolymer transport system component
MILNLRTLTVVWGIVLLFGILEIPGQTAPLSERLSQLPFKLVCETYQNNNWELFIMNADGSERRNLTRTPDHHEMYPQVSPDGTKICFVSDQGQGRKTVRSICLMDLDGGNRATIADHARQPFWHPNSKVIAYLPQEYPKFHIADYFTKGLVYYDVSSGTTRPHPNAGKLHHLYNPCFAPNGKWIAATVHAGMGHKHANLLIEADGSRIINLGIGGCRPCLSPDGTMIAWGEGDHKIAVAEIDLDAPEPRIGARRFAIVDAKEKTYHVDWAPDSAWLSLSRGPSSEGDPAKPGTHQFACEVVGVYAAGWDILVVPLGDKGKTADLRNNYKGKYLNLTANQASNKESDWFHPSR